MISQVSPAEETLRYQAGEVLDLNRNVKGLRLRHMVGISLLLMNGPCDVELWVNPTVNDWKTDVWILPSARL